MFGEAFSGGSKASAYRLQKNHTDIPEHLLLCVIHELSGTYDAYNEVWDADDLELIYSMDIAKQTCILGDLYENVFRVIVLVFGLPGNIIAAIVALSLERAPTTIFVAALSMGDFLTVVFRTTKMFSLVLEYSILKVSIGFFPNTILVLICFERYLAVCHPFKKRRWITIQKAYYLVAMLVPISCCAYAAIYAIAISQLRVYSKLFLAACILFGLPCPFIITFNWLTVHALKNMIQFEHQNAMQARSWSRAEASITNMISVASVVFLALNGPMFGVCFTWFMLEAFYQELDLKFRTRMDTLVNFTYWMTFLHHGVNFYVYVLGTKRFRRQFLYLLHHVLPNGWGVDAYFNFVRDSHEHGPDLHSAAGTTRS